MHEEFTLLQEEERIKSFHMWVSMARCSIKMWKTFHYKWSFITNCVLLNILLNSTSMILSTSNEYSITFMTLQKALKPHPLTPSFVSPMTAHCKNYVQRFFQPNSHLSPNRNIECWKWNLHSTHYDGGGTCFSQRWDSTWTNPLFSQMFHCNV